jgi:hypothetical protein
LHISIIKFQTIDSTIHLFFGSLLVLLISALDPALVILMSHLVQIFPILLLVIVSVGVN